MNVLENLEREAVNFEGWGLPRASVDTADLALLLAAVRAARDVCISLCGGEFIHGAGPSTKECAGCAFASVGPALAPLLAEEVE